MFRYYTRVEMVGPRMFSSGLRHPVCREAHRPIGGPCAQDEPYKAVIVIASVFTCFKLIQMSLVSTRRIF